MSDLEQARMLKLYERELERLRSFEVPAKRGQYITYSEGNVSNPPTEAEITAIFGAPADIGPGKFGMINDGGLGVNEYLCMSDPTSWRYVTLQKAL